MIPKNINKRVELAFAPSYLPSQDPVYLFDYHPKEFNSRILYYIRDYENAGDLFPLTTHEIDFINARNIIPGRGVQIAHAQKYSSHIRYMFPDPLNEAGWQIYSMQMILNGELGKWDKEYQILKLKEEVMIICQAFIEGKYYSGEINRKDALFYIKKHALQRWS